MAKAGSTLSLLNSCSTLSRVIDTLHPNDEFAVGVNGTKLCNRVKTVTQTKN
jgi:hypothetical protein